VFAVSATASLAVTARRLVADRSPRRLAHLRPGLLHLGQAAKLVLQQGSTGKYHFNLVAINGQV